jgi:hypothetical protein
MMMRSPTQVAFLACSMVLVSRHAHASASSRPLQHSLSVGTLVGVRSVRDDLLVPLASTGPVLSIEGRFLGTFHGSIVDTELRGGFAAVFDRDLRPAVALGHRIRMAYLPLIVDSPDRWSLAVGPTLVWETDVAWFSKWDDAHGYWMGRRWAGVSARAWRRLSPRWRLDLTGDCSLLGFESRPPAYRSNKEDALTHVSYYFADVNRHARFGWLGDWQAVRLRVEAHRPSSRAKVPVGWGYGVEARIAHTDAPTNAWVLESSLWISYAWGVR